MFIHCTAAIRVGVLADPLRRATAGRDKALEEARKVGP
jgi:hypothetical protein